MSNHIEQFELNKTCVVCRQTKSLDDFDKLTDKIEIPLKPDVEDWLNDWFDRRIEQFSHAFEKYKLDKSPEMSYLEGIYETEAVHCPNILNNDVDHMKSVMDSIKEDGDEDGTGFGTKKSKMIGYILETIRQRAQDSRKDECKDCSSRKYIHYK
jgi:hypothetical protein